MVPQLNFGLRASLPIGYLPTKLLSDRPPRAETLPLSEEAVDEAEGDFVSAERARER